MPATASEAPSVSLSFANNFWGKDDAGVSPLLERMHNAKVTSDELKAFYTARAALEDEYARKLLSLARKPLGSSEAGTLRMSLDVVRGEVESVGKQHQNVAQQMKTELDEQLAAFAGGMKERRKIVQGGIEKLLKMKTQQTMAVNKARDRYEQDCLKIKGYLAQGHMVMGQEERKNKAKLEKTQIQLSTTCNEYEASVRVLEETTGRWNREWKVACDKFQDLEEERIDFMKSSLWSFANIASTVCVSDDASCEKIRLSLEDCDVEKDISSFLKECSTGQEIPDPPKFIDFCRGDINDTASISDDGDYSVAQFQRVMNPSFRTSSPQPSNVGSSHDPKLERASEVNFEHKEYQFPSINVTPRKSVGTMASSPDTRPTSRAQSTYPTPNDPRPSSRAQQNHQSIQRKDFAEVPHNEYPMDGMTQFCRVGPPSERSSVASPVRPTSRSSISECSIPTSYTSAEPSLLSMSSAKALSNISSNGAPMDELNKKKSGFFQNRSPFRRKSQTEKERPQKPLVNPSTGNKTGWTPASSGVSNTAGRQLNSNRSVPTLAQSHDRPSPSPEPVDPRAQFQLNVGNNVFDVASPDDYMKGQERLTEAQKDFDPIAKALAELKGVTKQSSVRISADRYGGIATPGPGGPYSQTPAAMLSGRGSPLVDRSVMAAQRGTPPPCYDPAAGGRLGAPQPAFTSKQMQQTTQKYVDQKQNMFQSPTRHNSYNQQQDRASPQAWAGAQNNRATSPTPLRSASPRMTQHSDTNRANIPRATSPSPYTAASNVRPHAQSTSPVKNDARTNSFRGYNADGSSPGNQYQPHHPQASRAVSPQPQFSRSQGSGSNDLALQVAPVSPIQQGQNNAMYGAPTHQSQPQMRGRGSGSGSAGARPVSQYGNGAYNDGGGADPNRMRSRSAAPEGRLQCTRDGRPILHFSRALYMYQAAIPEELSFNKGDTLAVLRLQDDGWWEAEIAGGRGRRGLVPSNYLTNPQ